MGFSGEYQNNMDAKGRVILPIKFRETIGEPFVLTKGIDRNLYIYSMEEWEKVEKRLAALKMTDSRSRALKRLLQGSAIELEIDNQDRITIPQNLRIYANLGKELLFVGQGEYIEIWSKSSFDEMSDNMNYAEVTEGLDF
ncbi:MAG: division/cell wall cluster transcriptional repressor MraZ [Lachnospiraceae bacterium]|nr:division/cell wall cluster transcriptional repressor MraZ [Lachnospiraceae bacterium]